MTTVVGIIEWVQATTPTPSPTTDTLTEAASGWSSPQVGAALVALAGTLVLTLLNYLTSRANGRRQEQLHRESLIAQKDDSGQINAREQLRLRTERFGRAADQMGSDEPLVRMAGVYAMAALADEHEDQAQRQKCIDVLCGYLRLPPRTGTGSADPQPGEEQVRVAIVDTIREHCQEDSAISWSDLSFDFTGAQFRGPASFYRAQFRRRAMFQHARFHDGALFEEAQFHKEASFWGARFCGSALFEKAQFHEEADFIEVEFHGIAWLALVHFHRGVMFVEAEFHQRAALHWVQFHKECKFRGVQFHEDAWFQGAQFHEDAWFDDVQFHADVEFERVHLHARASFRGSQFHGNQSFCGARTTEGIDLTAATIAEGCFPSFTLADGSTTDELPVIEANWDGTDPDNDGQVDVTDRRHGSDSSRTNTARSGETEPAQAGNDRT